MATLMGRVRREPPARLALLVLPAVGAAVVPGPLGPALVPKSSLETEPSGFFSGATIPASFWNAPYRRDRSRGGRRHKPLAASGQEGELSGHDLLLTERERRYAGSGLEEAAGG